VINLLSHDIALSTKLLGEPKKLLSCSFESHDKNKIQAEFEHEHGNSSIYTDRLSKNTKERITTLSHRDYNFSFSPQEKLLDQEILHFLYEENGEKNDERQQIDTTVAKMINEINQSL